MDFGQITVKELYKFCKAEIANGNGDKFIVISDDNEGSGFHGLFYGFVLVDEDYISYIYDSQHMSPEDTIILG